MRKYKRPLLKTETTKAIKQAEKEEIEEYFDIDVYTRRNFDLVLAAIDISYEVALKYATDYEGIMANQAVEDYYSFNSSWEHLIKETQVPEDLPKFDYGLSEEKTIRSVWKHRENNNSWECFDIDEQSNLEH